MLNLKGLNNSNNKPTIKLVGLSKTVKSKTTTSNSKPRKRKSKYRDFEERDGVLSIYNYDRVNLTPFIKDKTIHIIKGNTPAHHKEAKLMAKEYYELFFEIFNESKEHIGYGVQIR